MNIHTDVRIEKYLASHNVKAPYIYLNINVISTRNTPCTAMIV